MKKIIVVVAAVALVSLSFFAGYYTKPQDTSAQGLPSFGGHLAFVDYCECSQTFDLFYFPASPLGYFPGGWLGYVPYATIVKPYYNMVTIGVWHMGHFVPGVQTCWVFHRHACVPLGEDATYAGMIFDVGTSLIPSPF